MKGWLLFPSILIVSATLIGCRPKDRDVLVAYVEGDVFLPDLRARPWRVGDSVSCYLASGTSVKPDKRGDLLLCGEQTQAACSQTWLRDDVRSQLYANAESFPVKFRSAGRDRGRYRGPVWTCKRTSETISVNRDVLLHGAPMSSSSTRQWNGLLRAIFPTRVHLLK